MAFTAKDVQMLRERTGVGMMDCKKALTAADGDMEKAIDFLREKGLAAAAKKSGRIASEGVVFAYNDEAAKVAVLVEVNSETDFVAKNDKFIAFVEDVAKTIVASNPADVDALLNCTIAGGAETVLASLQDKILTIGENIKIRRFVRTEGIAATYVHGGGRIGVLVEFNTTDEAAANASFKELGKDVAMQIAAINPLFLNKESVPAETVEHEKAILTEQAINEGKPAAIAEKMVIGRIAKYYKENCLVEQAFVKNGDVTVQQQVDAVAKEIGATIVVKNFVRFERGEGIEKKADNFADEVASMIK
ncbi:MAG: elongation factor Ts [Clostridia bacterium]|nr:elongation factor Ts [Clostridia bacterium]